MADHREVVRCKGVFEEPGRPGYKRFCRRKVKNYSGYCLDHQYQVGSEFPILVIGVTDEAAHEYARSLRLDDYIVAGIGGFNRIQGLRLRGIVVTPGYLLEQEKVQADGRERDHMLEYHVALQSFLRYPVPRG